MSSLGKNKSISSFDTTTLNYTNDVTCSLGKKKAYRSVTQKHLIIPMMSPVLLEKEIHIVL